MDFLKKNKLPLSLVLCATVLCGVALADVFQQGYNPHRGATPPAVVQSTSSTESMTWTSTPLHPLPTLGNPNVGAQVLLSTTSATCDLVCGLYFLSNDNVTYTFLGYSKKVTITAGGASDLDNVGGYHPGLTTASFDTYGANTYDLRISAISAGNVVVRPWVYGTKSQ